MDELKKCPFCGGEAEIVTFLTAIMHKKRFQVKCTVCFCSTDWYNLSEKEAKSKWNKRADDDRAL